jgi:PadR family transcriptional regulator, regulatory protein PadR
MADVLGVFEQAVLVAVLRLRGDGYGRTILHEVARRLNRDVTASAVYATLERLEAKGLVASRAGEATPQRGGRARRHFSITAAGVRALDDSRKTATSIWRGISLPLKGRS